MAKYRAVRQKISFLDLCRNPSLCADVMAEACGDSRGRRGDYFLGYSSGSYSAWFRIGIYRRERSVIRNPFRTAEDLRRMPERFNPASISFVFETAAETRRVVPHERA